MLDKSLLYLFEKPYMTLWMMDHILRKGVQRGNAYRLVFVFMNYNAIFLSFFLCASYSFIRTILTTEMNGQKIRIRISKNARKDVYPWVC